MSSAPSLSNNDLRRIHAPRLGLSLSRVARIIDGNRIRDQIKGELKPRVSRLAAQQRVPGLAVVLVGNHAASEVYVRNKVKTCEELGMCSEQITPPDSISTEELLVIVDELNAREDVDGFHPYNVGCLVAALPAPRACTPAGILQLLKRYQIPIAGKRAVVVGRSDIVGKPVALLLLHEHATVTICHSKTPDLAGVCREAEILVAAIGRAGMLTADFIRPGATVVDVGTNHV